MAERLPQILQEVADLAGLGAALQLASARGGRRLYVPQQPTDQFIADIGAKAARALSELYPNEIINVPLGPEGVLKRARRIAEEALERGASAGEAAALSGFSERMMYIRKAKRRARETSDQDDLFRRTKNR